VPLLADRGLVDGNPTAYICHGFVWQAPLVKPEALQEQLR
jgi:hypothetical protein